MNERAEVMDWSIWGDGSAEVLDWPNLGEVSPVLLRCPTCGLHVTLFVDTSQGTAACTERCPLCLRAVHLNVTVNNYCVTQVAAQRPF